MFSSNNIMLKLFFQSPLIVCNFEKVENGSLPHSQKRERERTLNKPLWKMNVNLPSSAFSAA